MVDSASPQIVWQRPWTNCVKRCQQHKIILKTKHGQLKLPNKFMIAHAQKEYNAQNDQSIIVNFAQYCDLCIQAFCV